MECIRKHRNGMKMPHENHLFQMGSSHQVLDPKIILVKRTVKLVGKVVNLDTDFISQDHRSNILVFPHFWASLFGGCQSENHQTINSMMSEGSSSME